MKSNNQENYDELIEINVQDCERAPPKEQNFIKELLDAIHRTSFSQVFHRNLDSYLSEENIFNMIRVLAMSIFPTEKEIANDYYSNYMGIGDDEKTYHYPLDTEEDSPYLTFRQLERFMNYKRDIISPSRDAYSFINDKVPILNEEQVMKRMYECLLKLKHKKNENEQSKRMEEKVLNQEQQIDTRQEEKINEDGKKEEEETNLKEKAKEYLKKFPLFSLYSEDQQNIITEKMMTNAVFLEYRQNHSIVFEKNKSDLMYCILFGSITEVHKVIDNKSESVSYQIDNTYPVGYCVGIENIFVSKEEENRIDDNNKKSIFITSHLDDSFVQQNSKCTVLAAIPRSSFLSACFDFHSVNLPETVIANSFRMHSFGNFLTDTDLSYLASISRQRTYALGEVITERDIKARSFFIITSGKGVWGFSTYGPGTIIGFRSCFTKDKTELKSAVATETTEALEIKVIDMMRNPSIFKKLVTNFAEFDKEENKN